MNVQDINEQVQLQVTEEVTEQMTFIQSFFSEIQAGFLAFSIKVMFAIIFLIIGMVIIHFIMKLLRRGLNKATAKNNTFQNTHFIEQTVKAILYVVLCVLIAQFFGVSAASVVALLGSAGLTIGLAFQGALSNFAGGVLLLIQRPFALGDHIIVGSNQAEGVVVQIGIIYTTLQFNPRKKIVVPNGVLANSTITNLSANGTRLLDLTFNISYKSDISLAKEILLRLAKEDDRIIIDENLLVYVSELSNHSVDIGFRAMVPQPDYILIKWSLLEKVKTAFEDAGIEIPYNQLEVHLNNSNNM